MRKAAACTKREVKKLVAKGVKQVKKWDIKQDAKLIKHKKTGKQK